MRKGLKSSLLVAAMIGLSGCGDEASTPSSAQASMPKSVAADAQLKPQHFANVQAMVEDFADFAEENGTFKLISSDPLHIQLAAQVVANDLEETIQTELQRVAIYGVYRTLIHTDAPAVHVTAVPMEITVNPYSARFLDAPKVDVVVTRDEALQAAKNLIEVESLTDLVTPDNSMGIQIDSWSSAFQPYYYKLEGQQAVLAELGGKR
ncbi:hypothetical protein [Stutzerimonas nitrititolerans]|uniref:hypothetical protein n=1 Tax=Stutzerimonas nitrititolerans TaxID=2482751 RepID=UPI003F80C1A2